MFINRRPINLDSVCKLKLQRRWAHTSNFPYIFLNMIWLKPEKMHLKNRSYFKRGQKKNKIASHRIGKYFKMQSMWAFSSFEVQRCNWATKLQNTLAKQLNSFTRRAKRSTRIWSILSILPEKCVSHFFSFFALVRLQNRD